MRPTSSPLSTCWKPLALDAADQVRRRDAEVLEGHLAGLDALVAELVDVAADGDARRARLGDEAG